MDEQFWNYSFQDIRNSIYEEFKLNKSTPTLEWIELFNAIVSLADALQGGGIMLLAALAPPPFKITAAGLILGKWVIDHSKRNNKELSLEILDELCKEIKDEN